MTKTTTPIFKAKAKYNLVNGTSLTREFLYTREDLTKLQSIVSVELV